MIKLFFEMNKLTFMKGSKSIKINQYFYVGLNHDFLRKIKK